jgi:hypothetical protein
MYNPSDSLLDSILKHPAGRKTHAHAIRFGNTNSDLVSFWRNVLERERLRGTKYIENVNRNSEYIQRNLDAMNVAINEVTSYTPPGYVFDCRLYLILGYDIGIVSEGDALLNIGHSHFHDDHRELVYYAMHELHHVCYTHYHPIFAIADIHTNKDLLDTVRYCTHMEGLAVYCPLNRRLSEQGFNDEDYRILLDSKESTSRLEEFFKIYSELRAAPTAPLRSCDYEILELMSGQNKRLWYTSGAYMAKQIDTHSGRKTLVNTIVSGAKSFFGEYERISHTI